MTPEPAAIEIISPAAAGVGMSEIVAARAYDVAIADLRGCGRDPQIVLARHVAIYLAHVVFALNFGRLAHAFGRHRSTMRHAVGRIEALRDDPRTDQTITWLETVLRSAAEAAR